MTSINTDPIIRDLRLALGVGGRPLDRQAVCRSLEPLHPSVIAAILDEITLPEAMEVFECLDDRRAAEALHEVSPETSRYLIERSPLARMAALLDLLPVDDAAEVVSEAREEDVEPLLAALPAGGARELRALLAYPGGSAGRLMTSRFAAVGEQTPSSQVLEYLRRGAGELETVNTIYVLDDLRRLTGVCSIREVLVAPPDAPVHSFMNPEPIAVRPEADQQAVSQLIAQYDLPAMPVVDAEGRLLGIVTVDDVIDVLVEEFEEDIARLVGTDAEEMERRSPAQVARLRLPWLLGTMAIELGAGYVIHRYDDVLQQVILLASFMPVISATSGNVGLQAAAIAVRGLDTGHMSASRWASAVRKELTTALLIALVCGTVLGAVGVLWSRHWPFGLVVGAALACAMLTAGLLGTLIPMASKRLGLDPATTAGPFETAFQDLIGFGVFLWLASRLLHWLS